MCSFPISTIDKKQWTTSCKPILSEKFRGTKDLNPLFGSTICKICPNNKVQTRIINPAKQAVLLRKGREAIQHGREVQKTPIAKAAGLPIHSRVSGLRLLFGDSYAYVDHFNEDPEDRREKAVIFVSSRDSNGAIFGGHNNFTIRDMAKRYNLMIQFTDSPDETFQRFLKITSDVDRLAHISFFAHGNRNVMSFAESGDFRVQDRENPLLRRVLSKLKADGTIALFSCSAGVAGGVADYMARHLSKRATIFSPTDRICFFKLVNEDSLLVSFRMLGLELGSERLFLGDRLRDITRAIRVTGEDICARRELMEGRTLDLNPFVKKVSRTFLKSLEPMANQEIDKGEMSPIISTTFLNLAKKKLFSYGA